MGEWWKWVSKRWGSKGDPSPYVQACLWLTISPGGRDDLNVQWEQTWLNLQIGQYLLQSAGQGVPKLVMASRRIAAGRALEGVVGSHGLPTDPMITYTIHWQTILWPMHSTSLKSDFFSTVGFFQDGWVVLLTTLTCPSRLLLRAAATGPVKAPRQALSAAAGTHRLSPSAFVGRCLVPR